ncbi:Rv3654c family TadE-like protein [Nocardioides sp.]|uniref:Rv3654c family TadE-like protein n=1 Tax=Nocardioides sp. TaxID=35761 RepID=UPI0035293ED0
MSGTHHGARGSASLFAVTMAGVLLFVGLALTSVTALVVDHRRAQSAADLAALAGAAASDPCGAAARIASANRARLVGCSVLGADVLVTVELESRAWPGHPLGLRATSRAGPA